MSGNIVPRAWLAIKKVGRCTAREVELMVGIDRSQAAHLLLKLHAQGCLARYEKKENDSTSRVRYGVTGECEPPRGIKLKDILE